MTTSVQAHQLSSVLLNARALALDERAAEFGKRQALLDVAGEAGHDPDTPLPTNIQRMYDGHSAAIGRYDALIDAMTAVIDASS